MIEAAETGREEGEPARASEAEPSGVGGGGARAPAPGGDAGAEYEAVRGGAGLIDLSSRGRAEVSGAEAVQFLNGMVTNDVARLEAGAWFEAAFPNAQGRLLSLARVFRRGDSFLFDTEEATRAAVLKLLERFTLAGDFRVRDLSGETAHFTVQGPRAARLVNEVLGAVAGATPRGRVAAASFGGGEVTVARATHTGEDGFDFFAGERQAGALWDALAGAGARPAGREALEVLRVEAGIPLYGVDATEQNVVSEVVDEASAVSYTKGCYVGQEIIARVHWRGHVAKKLTGLLFEGDAEVPPGARLRAASDGREAGRVTSTVYSPRLARDVALALVKYDFLQPGTELKVYAGDDETGSARVADLPLVRGSWFEAESPAASDAGGVGGSV